MRSPGSKIDRALGAVGRLELLRRKDKHREWRSEVVDPALVHPTKAELGEFLDEADFTVSGLSDLVRDFSRRHPADPLILQDRGDQGLWMDPSTHGLGGPNNIAMLLALRQTGVTGYEALIYTDKVKKDDYTDEGDDEEGDWEPDAETKQKVHNELKLFLLAILAGISYASEDDLFRIATEGAAYGGGFLTTDEIKRIAREAQSFNAEHAAGFEEDAMKDLAEVLGSTYRDMTDFERALEDYMNGIAERADLYAAGGGKQAWTDAIGASARKGGTSGCYWNCKFGPGSCDDCMSLHGQWMTWEDFYDTYQQTICDGGCNCGPVPADGPDELDPADLEMEEAA